VVGEEVKHSTKHGDVARAGRRGLEWLRPLVLAFTAALAMAAAGSPALLSGAHGAETDVIDYATNVRAVAVRVTAGKSENVHTDVSFSDVVVGDPEIADVAPLTDHTLSILGKKIGMTRVSVYGAGKKLVAVLDVEVSYDVTRLGAELSRRFPHAQLRVSSVNGRIMLSGSAPDGVTVDAAMRLAKQFGPEVINSVYVSQPQQVMLEVRFIEVSRTASRELGIQWNVLSSNVNATLGLPNLISNSPPFGTVVANLLNKGTKVDAIIRALEERDMARRLAEPNLVALSGDTASFLAGGEFPFPVAGQLGTVSVEWKRFGVGLAFTPSVLSNGLINLKIEPEVSQLDPSNVLQVGNVTLPSLIVRRVNTTIELRDGQSFAMAGLLQNTGTTNQQQLPWIGDVPVLGALFRSAQYQKKETDLAVIVTPHIVRPTRPGDTVRVPTDSSTPANDPDFFLLGQSELPPSMKRRVDDVPPPITGHILNLTLGAAYAVR
jgi:pilus assembly protein CpaC